MNAIKHFCTITKHKNLVMAGCFKIGLYKQGLLHDLSKYGPTEFLVGCKYYKGYMSPNNAERAATGVSTAWLHHKGRNKHHLEYWIDYGAAEDSDEAHKGMQGMKMPIKYVAEMFIDRVSASKNSKGEIYRSGTLGLLSKRKRRLSDSPRYRKSFGVSSCDACGKRGERDLRLCEKRIA